MQVELIITGEFSDIFDKILDLPEHRQIQLMEKLCEINKGQSLNITLKREKLKLFVPNILTGVDAQVIKL